MTPGTVKGTIRVGSNALKPGMVVRLCGPRAKSSAYVDDSRPRPAESMNSETWRAWRAEVEIRGDREIEKIESFVDRPKGARRGTRWYRVFWVEGGYTVLAAVNKHDVYSREAL